MAAIQNVRLFVFDWDGTYRHERFLEHTDPALRMNVPASGFEVGRTGRGGCLELTFQAMWHTLGVQERDLVELEVMYVDDPVWYREYAGVVVKSGNSQVTGHSNFKAVGLKKRLAEVRCDLAGLPEQDAGASIRQVVQLASLSSELGTAITFNPPFLPDLGVVVAAFSPYGRKISDVLDYLCAQGGAMWDVDAGRNVFIQDTAIRPAMFVSDDMDVTATFEDTDSEALVTRVLFTLGQRADGTLVQHSVTAPEAATFGVAVKDVVLDASVSAWLPTAPAVSGAENVVVADGEASALTDGQKNDAATASPPTLTYALVDAAQPGQVAFTLQAPAARVDIDVNWTPITAGRPLLQIEVPGAQITQNVFPTVVGETYVIQDYLEAGGMETLPAGTVLTFTLRPGQTLRLAELAPRAPDGQMLSRLAAFHYELPHRDPAVVTVGSRVTPAPMLSLMREDGSTYENTVESVTTHLKLAGGARTVIRAGQRESAEARAARWLGQLALMDATQTAVRARSGT